MADMMQFPKSVEDFMEQYKIIDTEQIYTNGAELVPIFRMKQWFEHIEALPAQPEHPLEIQDILDYLDTVLHPIISPEYWNVYSELYDMISTLPSAERHGQWKDIPFTARWICSNCDYISEFASFKYCPDCGARMDLEEYK